MSKTDDLIKFHEVMGVLVKSAPGFPSESVIELRKKLLQEEYTELMDAIEARDMTEVADGLVDLVVIAIGTAVSFGIPFDECWAEIHRTNMAKVDPVTGKVRKREDGKVLKPEGWEPPNIAGVLEKARRRWHDKVVLGAAKKLAECDRRWPGWGKRYQDLLTAVANQRGPCPDPACEEERVKAGPADMIREQLAELNPDALFMDGFDDALVGYATQYTKQALALYDRDKCIKVLMDRDGMSYEEAEEFFSFNCECAWFGENTPLIAKLGGE